MNQIFSQAAAFNQDLSAWNVSGVTDMQFMFSGASTFNQPLSEWDVSRVTDTKWMFFSAAAFDQDLSAWNVSGVTDMQFMFFGASAFNQDLSEWDVSRVTTMELMFSQAAAFNQDLSAWDVSRVTSIFGMFLNASAFNQTLCGPTWVAMSDPLSSVNISEDGCQTSTAEPCPYGYAPTNNPSIEACAGKFQFKRSDTEHPLRFNITNWNEDVTNSNPVEITVAAGTYTYACTSHSSMTGSFTVKDCDPLLLTRQLSNYYMNPTSTTTTPTPAPSTTTPTPAPTTTTPTPAPSDTTVIIFSTSGHNYRVSSTDSNVIITHTNNPSIEACADTCHHSGTRVRYRDKRRYFSQSCVSETQTQYCNGTWNGTFAHRNCTQDAPRRCPVLCGDTNSTVGHGENVTMFGPNNTQMVRACSDGAFNPNFDNCTHVDIQTTAAERSVQITTAEPCHHSGTRVRYRDKRRYFSQSCVSETQTQYCNGTWNGTFTHTNCTLDAPRRCPVLCGDTNTTIGHDKRVTMFGPNNTQMVRACSDGALKPNFDNCTSVKVDCEGSFGICDANCKQMFSIVTPARHNGVACAYTANYSEWCTGGACPPDPTDCQGGFSACASTCTRSYLITRPATNGGAICTHVAGHSEFCATGDCAPPELGTRLVFEVGDVKRINSCFGEKFTVIWNGHHNLIETPNATCRPSENDTEWVRVAKSTPFKFTSTALGGMYGGHTRYYMCNEHCKQGARFEVYCPPEVDPNRRVTVNSATAQLETPALFVALCITGVLAVLVAMFVCPRRKKPVAYMAVHSEDVPRTTEYKPLKWVP